ncbi:hypothetical protein FRC17_001146 [Serendipita sp. 399]|nr:hypothetical protein FRC17_001146 [Serendipita sp. 399]
MLAVTQGADAFALDGELLKGGGGGGGGGRGGGGGGGGSRGGSGGGSRGASTGRGGSGDTGKPAIRTTFGSFDSASPRGRVANYFSRGGGKPFVLGAASVFAGRKMGGGLREQIVGSPRYASGYPYTNGDVMKTGVSGQPFPFGFWPVYWGRHGHGGEYVGGEGHAPNMTVTDQRPGGELVYVQLSPREGSKYDYSDTYSGLNDTYYMIGDKESVSAMMSLLTDMPSGATFGKQYGCGAESNPILQFLTTNPDGSPLVYPNVTATNTTTGTNTTTTTSGTHNTTRLPIRFENVMTWYRASSFAIAYENYTNAFALAPLNETTGIGWENSTPLPSYQQISGFLECVNRTIITALPILDAEKKVLDAGAIAGIVIASISGAVLLGVVIWYVWKQWEKRKQEYKPVEDRDDGTPHDEKDPESK